MLHPARAAADTSSTTVAPQHDTPAVPNAAVPEAPRPGLEQQDASATASHGAAASQPLDSMPVMVCKTISLGLKVRAAVLGGWGVGGGAVLLHPLHGACLCFSMTGTCMHA